MCYNTHKHTHTFSVFIMSYIFQAYTTLEDLQPNPGLPFVQCYHLYADGEIERKKWN